MNGRNSSIQEINEAFSSKFNKLWNSESSTLMEDRLSIQVKPTFPETWFDNVIHIIEELNHYKLFLLKKQCVMNLKKWRINVAKRKYR